MNPHLTLAVNMSMVPGVKDTGLEHNEDGAVVVTVTGGNPKTVAAMILQCLPPGTPTDGDTLVEVEGTVVKLNHVDPTPEQPEDFVAPLPLVTPEGRHEPQGVTLGRPAPHHMVPNVVQVLPYVIGVLLLLVGLAVAIILTVTS